MFRQVIDGLAGIRFLTEGKSNFCAAVIRAHRDFRKQRTSMVSKRKAEIEACRGRSASEASRAGRYAGSVVWAFFVKGAKRWSDLAADRIS